jgi:type II secretory pathway pseudopilin PulG
MKFEAASVSREASKQCGEDGYTLVSLLALMTVLALFAMAAAPSIRQQAEREREVEAIFRGEQVADAIRAYYTYQQGKVGKGDTALPTSMEKLLEGLPSGTKKIQILRASAAREPLSPSGEWRLVRPRSRELGDFTRSLILYAGNTRPATTDSQLQQVEELMAPPVVPTLDIATADSASPDEDNSSGPFIGVTSRDKNNSVISYYGISQHNRWIFTPLFK